MPVSLSKRDPSYLYQFMDLWLPLTLRSDPVLICEAPIDRYQQMLWQETRGTQYGSSPVFARPFAYRTMQVAISSPTLQSAVAASTAKRRRCLLISTHPASRGKGPRARGSNVLNSRPLSFQLPP